MRFHIGAIPNSPDFLPDESWNKLKEPPSWAVQFIALPIGVGTTFTLGLIWLSLTPFSLVSHLPSMSEFLFGVFAITIIHELLHAVTHPGSGISNRSIIGFWPSHLICYAHYDGELSRNRFIAILLMPFFIISILPIAVAFFGRALCPWLAWISIFNALLACVDIFGIFLLTFQISSSSILRNQGWKTYWRERILIGQP